MNFISPDINVRAAWMKGGHKIKKKIQEIIGNSKREVYLFRAGSTHPAIFLQEGHGPLSERAHNQKACGTRFIHFEVVIIPFVYDGINIVGI